MRIYFLLWYDVCGHLAFRPRVLPLPNILRLLLNIPIFQPLAQPTLILSSWCPWVNIWKLKAWQWTVQPRINKAMLRNQSSCLHGVQDRDPLQVIRLENPQKIWLFLLVLLSRLLNFVLSRLFLQEACLESDSSSASSDFSAIGASDFYISKSMSFAP